MLVMLVLCEFLVFMMVVVWLEGCLCCGCMLRGG